MYAHLFASKIKAAKLCYFFLETGEQNFTGYVYHGKDQLPKTCDLKSRMHESCGS